MHQIEFALERDLPLMLHIRPSVGTVDAHLDALNILESFKSTEGERLRGTAHFFTSTPEIAQRYIDLGFHITFPGVVTFAKETQEAARTVPLERILVETDSPYASPIPHRGERNEPVFVIDVAKKIAELRGEDPESVRKQLLLNSSKLFSL